MLPIIVAAAVVIGGIFYLSSKDEELNKRMQEYDINGFETSTKRDKAGKCREDYSEQYNILVSKCLNMKKLHDQKMYSELVASSRAVCEAALKQSLSHWGYDSELDFLKLIDRAANAGLISEEEQDKLHSIRKHGNSVMHDNEKITQNVAFFCWRTTEEIVKRVFKFYTNN